MLDPEAGGEQLAQRLDRELDAAVLTHSQKPGPMADASQKLAEAIATRRLVHPDDQALTRHVISAGARFMGAMWRFVKPKGRNLPIDATVALAMAVRVLHATEGVPADPQPDVTARTSEVFFG